VCDLDIGDPLDPSRFRVLRKVPGLVRMFPTLDLSYDENTKSRKWNSPPVIPPCLPVVGVAGWMCPCSGGGRMSFAVQ